MRYEDIAKALAACARAFGRGIMRKWLVAAAVVVMAAHAVPAQAATINLNSDGRVTGIDDLEVNGSLYDITFFGAGLSYNAAYGGANIAYGVDVANAIKAFLNAQTSVPNIAGTTHASMSGFAMPFGVSASLVDILTSSRPTRGGPTLLYTGPLFAFGQNRNGTLTSPYAWTLVTPDVAVSETPLPGALPLFATGIAGLGFVMRRRKRKQAA